MEVMTMDDSPQKHRSPLYPRVPVLAQDIRRTEVQAQFLKAYEQLGTITAAAEACNLTRMAHYQWLESDEDYREAWTDAQEGSTQNLERAAIIRAVDGAKQGVWHQGVKVGEEVRYSDNLLMFMLKGRRPEVYKDRTELTGANGGPVQVQAVRSDALARLDPVALDALRRLNGGAMAQLPAPAEDGEVIESPEPEPAFAPESETLKAKE